MYNLVVYNFHLLEYILATIRFELGYVICYSEVIVKSLKHKTFQGYTSLTDK